MKILTTLAEKDYFLGVAALVNSIVKYGTYVDKIIVGYRFELPNWLPALKPSKNGQSCILPSGIEMELINLDGSLHMVHEKPNWFRRLTHELEPGADEYFFFDSDIVILNRMDFFGEWLREGVALCEDINEAMAVTHPIRQQWKRLAEEKGMTITNQLDRYYNSGFLGWSKNTASFIDEWKASFAVLETVSGDMKKFRVNDRTRTVLSTNQDSLNLAAMITKHPIATLGPEAMGFRYGLSLMAHPIGPKPWKRKFGREFLAGKPPRSTDIIFWENVCGSELNPFSAGKAKSKVRYCKMLKGLGRFYRKEGL